ncbi:MAG: DUF1015 domain-containing protein [Aridibacter sp.]
MATIKPFRALRPKKEQAKQVSCVPYDVVYTSEVRKFIAANPLSFLRVTRAEAEFPEDYEASHEEIFERAKENLKEFVEGEILTQDDQNCIYIYRVSTGEHSQTGVVACCSIDEYESGIIKKHENVRPDKVEDRTKHLIKLEAQTGLIFFAFRGTQNIKNLISEAVKAKPIIMFHCSDGIKHTVWRVTDTQKWVEAFEDVPSLYIADGHHRAESSKRARDYFRAENPEHTGDEEYNTVVAGMYPSEDLRILAYNRVVKDLGKMSEAEFFEKLTENFEITETQGKVPEEHGEIYMYMNARWWKLRFIGEIPADADPKDKLDVSILQHYLLAPILGIEDIQTDRRIGFVGGKRGTQELEKIVDEGIAKVAFSMFPTTLDDLFTVSDADEIMPPKSTWFEPKLQDGLLVHLI